MSTLISEFIEETNIQTSVNSEEKSIEPVAFTDHAKEESMEPEASTDHAKEESMEPEASTDHAKEESIEPEASTIPTSEKSEMVLSNEQKDSKPSTSSALMYSEYMNTSEPERVTRIFERKTKKPVILSYGESPLYRKYSELLKKLKESSDEYPTGWGKKFPIVKVHLLMKRKNSDSDEDDDEGAAATATENSSIMIVKKKDDDCDDSSSEDSSDDEQPISSKPQVKIEVLDEAEDSELKDGSDSDMSTPISEQESGPISCEFIDTCVDSSLTTEIDKSESINLAKKQRID